MTEDTLLNGGAGQAVSVMPSEPRGNTVVRMANDTGQGCFRKLTDKLSCRQVLNIMVFFGFMVNYMLRVNLTIAIVEMVSPTFSGNLTAEDSSNFTSDLLANITSDVLMDQPELEGKELDLAPVSEIIPLVQKSKYDWDAYKQNLIHGSFYWGYICTELPGGRLSEVIGARRVWGYSLLVASAVTLFTPIAADLSYKGVIILRVIIGFMLGVTFPAIQPLASKWIPPNERSKFISNMMASSLGAAVTLPVCGFLISVFGWASVFYVTGVVGLIWSAAWFLLVSDTPGQHPRITVAEREYIEESIGIASKTRKALKVPWAKVLTSAPVWAIVITHGASVFCYFTVVNQLPTYMNTVLNFNIKENGFFSSFPYLGKYLMALLTGFIADWIKSKDKMSTTTTRKLFTGFAVGLPGLLMFLQVFKGDQATWAVIIFTVALTLNGAVTAGYLGNALDIAPNFSGTIFGMANTLSSIGGFLSAFMVGELTYQNQTYQQWQKVFWILAGVYFLGSLVYIVCGTAKMQEWNEPPSIKRHPDETEVELGEQETLNKDKS